MTDVGRDPTARSGRRRTLLLSTTICAVVVLSTVLLSPARPAGADQLSDARAQAAALSAQIQADGEHLDVLSQQYDAARQQLAAAQGQVVATEAAVARDQTRVAADQARLRQAAVSAYMAGAGGSDLTSLFSPVSDSAEAAQEYTAVATDSLSDAIDGLHRDQASLSDRQARLQSQEQQAQAVASALATDQQQAQAAQAAQQAVLGRVTGQIAALVAAQQAAAQAQAAATFSARTSGPAAPTSVAVSPGAAGAVQAAESQLGVPYRYGAEDPGVGFDCSGLTQWAWGQAGVSLPRTAADQYDAIPHIPLSDLQPGDLLFWNDGTSSIQHVAMYVGNGEVIQAPYTGARVSYAAIWTNGLVGAGRP